MIFYKYTALLFFLINLILLSPDTSADEDSTCDIFCQAGIALSDIEPATEERTSNDIIKSSKLAITDTKSTEKILKSYITILEEFAQQEMPFSMDIKSAYGTNSFFSIDGFKLIFQDTPSPIELLSIDSQNCSGTNVNTYDHIYSIYSDLRLQKDYYKDFPEWTCEVNNISLNLKGIFELDGESLEDELGYGQAELIYDLFSNIDYTYSYSSSFDVKSDELVGIGNFIIDFNDQVVFSIFIEDNIYGTKETIKNSPSQFWIEFFETAIDDPDWIIDLAESSGLMSSSQTLYNSSLGISWSNGVYRDISNLSEGVVDAGMMLAKASTANKMNKYEVQMLLQNFGFDRELQGLYLDIIYSYYDNLFDEIKIFVNDPRGIMIELDFAEGLDTSILEKLDENPMLFFTILNNMDLSINANPNL
jgi:hypothetical protein